MKTCNIDPPTFYKCLSEDTRLKCLLLLQQREELCVCDLIQALGLSQPRVSRHLAELRACDLVVDERRGRWVYYRLNPALPDWSLSVLAQTAAALSNDYLWSCRQRLAVNPNDCG